jgi:hypothetical protein
MDSSLIKGKIPTVLTTFGYFLYFIGYCIEVLALHGCCFAGFIFLLLGFLADIVLIKMSKPQNNEALLPTHRQQDFGSAGSGELISTKIKVNIIFLIACGLDILWQIIARTTRFYSSEAFETALYFYLFSMLVVFVLFGVASSFALSKADSFYTNLKVLAKITYGLLIAGSAINALALFILVLAASNIAYVRTDYNVFFMLGHIFIGLGFGGRIAFNEIKY